MRLAGMPAATSAEISPWMYLEAMQNHVAGSKAKWNETRKIRATGDAASRASLHAHLLLERLALRQAVCAHLLEHWNRIDLTHHNPEMGYCKAYSGL